MNTVNKTGNAMKLKYFNVDPTRHDLVVDVEFYQMNLINIVNQALDSELEALRNDTTGLPSWSKFAAYPAKAKGFFTNMLQAIFEGKHNADELNVDLQTNRVAAVEGPKVAMVFLPGSTTNVNLLEAAAIAQQALQGFVIVPISGAADVTNATAEATAKEAVERAHKAGKHVILLSAGMAQRSFSIPEITELYLAYDSGDNGATIQKMSRAFTPGIKNKVGRVISLSFDPNRDDKFDAMLLETAQNYKENKGIKDLKDALAAVIRTIDIFNCQPDGAIKIESDKYLEDALARNSIDRVLGKVAKLDTLTPEMISAIAQGNVDLIRAAVQDVAEKGKTRANPLKKASKKNSPKDVSQKEIAKAREVIVTIAQNIDIIRYQGGSTIDEAFDIIDAMDAGYRAGISEDFGVDYELIKHLVTTNVINRDLLELKFS